MSFNVLHVDGDIPVLYGEKILFTQKNVKTSFSGSYPTYIKGTYDGSIYVTDTLIIFVRKTKNHDILTSFSSIQQNIKSMDVGQPLFGCNFLKLKISPEPGGGAIGDITAKFEFYDGGTYDCYKVLQTNRKNLTGVFAGDSNNARPNIPQPPPCPTYRNDACMGNYAPFVQNQRPPNYNSNVQVQGPPIYNPNMQFQGPPNNNPNFLHQAPPNYDSSYNFQVPPKDNRV